MPVITFSLKRALEVDIRVMNEDKITADRHNGTYVELYISYVENKEKISIVVDGVRYTAVSKDDNHFAVWLTDIKRQKKCTAELFDGNDLIGTVDLEIKGKTASVNSDFDDLF